MKKTILFGLCTLLLVSLVNAVPEPYNLSDMGNSSGIVGLAQKVNVELMGGYFGALLLITIFAISTMGFLAATNGHTGKSVTAASYITFVLSILLRILDLVSDIVMYVALFLTALCVVFMAGKE